MLAVQGGVAMLQSLDVLIGFTVIMLIMSMVVTMATQLLTTSVLELRGRSLKVGISRILALMDRGLAPAEAEQLADHLLRNPMVGTARFWGKGYRLAGIVHREELAKLILDFAVPAEAEKADRQARPNEEALRAKLQASLARNGIADPQAVLEKVRMTVLALERSNPEMSHSARLNLALLDHATSDFLSKLNSWFDQTIDRVSDLFTRRVRLVTILASMLVALVVQLDAIGLINRLSADSELRIQLVAAAVENPERFTADVMALRERKAKEAGLQTDRAAPVTVQETLGAIEEAGFRDISTQGLVSLPTSWEDWRERIHHASLLGILLAAALLSLGAPFWYAILGNLLKLRSVIARKDERERTERQTTQPPPTVAPAPTS